MGVEQIKKSNDMDLKTYQKEGKKLEEKAKGYFQQAQKPFEQAYEINPSDLKLLSSMRTMYQQLGDEARSKALDKEYEMATQ